MKPYYLANIQKKGFLNFGILLKIKYKLTRIMNKKLIIILTYCGSIPFIFFTYLKLKKQIFFLNINIDYLFLSYSTIILSFICGIHFAYALSRSKLTAKFLLLSNICCLICWLALLIKAHFALIILITLYCGNLYIDYLAYKNKLIKKWFIKLRVNITIIVLITILINLALLIEA
jgi:hypothetical protein